MPEPPPEAPPEYKVYRSRRRPLGGLKRPELFKRGPSEPSLERPRARRPLSAGRVLKWVLLALFSWLLLSFVVFMVSATLQEGVSDSAEDALSGGGSMLTGSTVLVIGSDERTKETAEPGSGGPGRADSLMLMHVGLGSVRKLSIPRDAYAEIPGHGAQKINASYALGGAALTVDTVEQYMGIEVNHVIEVSFANFPEFIDAIGGVDIRLRRCIRSQPFGGRVFRLRRGEHHLNGRQALAFARIRKNACSPNEDDRARARRQQQVLAAIRDQLISPSTFVRLPWVAWEAPRAVVSDMQGPGLLALFADVMTGGAGRQRVLEFTGAGPAGSVTIPEEERRREARRLVG